MSPSESVDDIKAELRAEYPSWSIIVSSKGRWWATRPTLVREDLSHTDGATLDADTAGELRVQLQAIEGAR